MNRRFLLALLISLIATHVAMAEQLRFEYSRYGGNELVCHFEKNRYWYESDGKKLSEHKLKLEEIQSLQAILQSEDYWSLPARMGNPRMDSYNALKVWRKGKPYTVLATDAPGREPKEAYERFARIIKAVQKVAPLP